MIYKLMTVQDLLDLHNNLKKPIFVKFPKNSSQTFLFNNTQYCHKFKGIVLYNDYKSVETTVKELLVEMTYKTYELHQLIDDADYQLALKLLEYYLNQTLPKEGLRFVYLLRLIIEDYESHHYPIASLSTVDFINYLLQERQSSWRELQTFLGAESFFSVDYLKTVLQSDNITVETFVKLSHFFKIPVQAFIVGGYG